MDYRRIIVIIFLLSGLLSLVWSIYLGATALALVGLGLTFFGVLFLLLGPLRQLEDGLLFDTASSEYSTINRIINDLKCTGDAFYLPPSSKSTQNPANQKNLKEPVVFISPRMNALNLQSMNERALSMPSTEETSGGKFLLKDRKGILVTPPGLGILKDIESKLGIDFTDMEIMQFCQIISNVLLEKFNLAKEIETMQEDSTVKFKFRNLAYKNLYIQEDNLTCVHLLGCPLASAIAVGLAKASKKNISIINESVSDDTSEIEIWFRIYS